MSQSPIDESANVAKCGKDIMFEVPSNENIEKVIITKEVVEKQVEPIMILGQKNDSKTNKNDVVS